MEELNLNTILNRTNIENKIIEILRYFEKNKDDKITHRGIYIYGNPGSGKTYFINDILKKLGYDIVLFDAGDVRNKNIINNISKYNMTDTNIISLFQKKQKKKAIIMDEIDGMNSGDKGGINSLIKLIRPKKTKKQKLEYCTMMPIICIGNYNIDKKIKELMKVCHVFELKTPNKEQIIKIINLLINNIDEKIINMLTEFIQGDLRKLKTIYSLYQKQENIFKKKMIQTIFQQKSKNEDTKQITKKLLNKRFSIDNHNILMNETDRTSIGLLFHENIIDVLKNIPKTKSIPFYLSILNNICFADYIDRITFQKQIWSFNEMSSLIKTIYNNNILHDNFQNINYNPTEVRFTKVLTKYSTEYNNMLFISNMCLQINMDKKDMLSFFIFLRNEYKIEDIYKLFDNDNYKINKLDINRIYRFLDNYCEV